MLYVCERGNDKILILDGVLNLVDSFSVPDSPTDIAVDDDYIYVGHFSTGKWLYKYNRTSPYSLITSVELPGVFGSHAQIAEYGNYLYVPIFVSGEVGYVYLFNKSDLSYYSRFEVFTWAASGVAVNSGYIYISRLLENLIKKFTRSTHVFVDSGAATDPGEISESGLYLYTIIPAGDVKIYKKSDLSLHKTLGGICEGSAYDRSTVVYGDYLFVTDWKNDVIKKVRISDGAIVDIYAAENPRGIATPGSNLPSKPTDLLCNGQTNPMNVIPSYFSAIYNDPDSGDIAKHYRIQVNKNGTFIGRMMWDSGKTAMSDVSEGSRCDDIYYNGQALSLNEIKYYWRIKFWDDAGNEGAWSDAANFIMKTGEGPWDEDIVEPTGEAKVEIPRRSGQWTALEDVMRIHTNVDKRGLREAVEIAQAEVTCCNISKNFNSFEEASDWYKQLEGFAVQISVGCKVAGTPISRKLFTGIISVVDVDRSSLTAALKVADFLDYFGRVTIEHTPIWENILLTQLYKNLVELAFPEWVEGVDYFVEDLGDITVPAIGYEKLNLLSELKSIAESRGMRIYTDINGKLVCRSRSLEGEPWDIRNDYNLEDVTEKRDTGSVLNWVVVHARPHEIAPDLEAPGKVAGFIATPGDQKIDLSWSNPTDEDFEKVLIRFSIAAYPLSIDDATKLYEGTGQSKAHTGLTNGKRYYYSAFTRDTIGNWSDAARTSAVAGVGGGQWEDETPPSRVSSFTATPERTAIVLTWFNPPIADFEKVVIRRSTTGYPPGPTSGASVYDGSGETTTDSGLSTGTKYYYSAFVKNTAGRYSGPAYACGTLTTASGTPEGPREILDSEVITGGKYEGPGGVGTYFDNYSKRVRLSFATKGKTEGWLRFRHEWDVQTTAGPKYSSNNKRDYGLDDDLSLSFSKSLGVSSIKVVKISCTAKVLVVDYSLVLTGKVLSIRFRNKLSLRG